MKELMIKIFFFSLCLSVSVYGQNTAAEDKLNPKPYCFTEVTTYHSFDEQTASQLRKELSLRYSNINILMSKQKIQFHICGKTELSIEDKMIRDLMQKSKVTIVSVFFSFVPFELNSVCEYPECE